MGIFSFIILNYSNKRTVLVEGKKKAATVFLLQPFFIFPRLPGF
jgi:hypothetical protein